MKVGLLFSRQQPREGQLAAQHSPLAGAAAHPKGTPQAAHTVCASHLGHLVISGMDSRKHSPPRNTELPHTSPTSLPDTTKNWEKGQVP